MNQDEAIDTIHKKIEREKALINAANAMRQSTNNPAVLNRLDSQIRDGHRNIEYLEGRLRELQMRKMGGDIEGMNLGNSGGPSPPRHGGPGSQRRSQNPITPPPKEGGQGYVDAGYGDSSTGDYSSQLSGGSSLMPPRPPYAPPGPGGAGNGGQSKPRGIYSKLGTFRIASPGCECPADIVKI